MQLLSVKNKLRCVILIQVGSLPVYEPVISHCLKFHQFRYFSTHCSLSFFSMETLDLISGIANLYEIMLCFDYVIVWAASVKLPLYQVNSIANLLMNKARLKDCQSCSDFCRNSLLLSTRFACSLIVIFSLCSDTQSVP